MKHLLLPILLLLAAPAVAQMQPVMPTQAELQASGAEMPALFKGANTVVVRATDSDSVMLRRAASILQQRGFIIEHIDYSLMSLSTRPKPYTGSGLHTVSINAVVIEKTLLLRGNWHGQIGTYSVDEPAQNTNRASRLAFSEVEAAAAAYTGATRTYKLQR